MFGLKRRGFFLAIQNFLSGGFYGKVGDVVGQRWHNKRTIRAHVIPHNPRTEIQQANRSMFAEATALAQIAYNINKGSPLWDTSQMPQFSQMVGLAKRRLQSGMTPEQALPLFPDGFIPQVTLLNITITWNNLLQNATIWDNSYTFSTARNMAILIYCKNELTNTWEIVRRDITILQGTTFAYTLDNDSIHSYPAGTEIEVVTVDDAQHGGNTIMAHPFTTAQTFIPLIQFKVTFAPFVYFPQWTIWQAYQSVSRSFYQDFHIDIQIYGYNIWTSSFNNGWMNWSEWDGQITSQIENGEPFDISQPIQALAGSYQETINTARFNFYWDQTTLVFN